MPYENILKNILRQKNIQKIFSDKKYAVSHTASHMEKDSYMDLYIYIYIDIYLQGISHRYRVAKIHRIPYLYRSFSAKVTYI